MDSWTEQIWTIELYKEYAEKLSDDLMSSLLEFREKGVDWSIDSVSERIVAEVRLTYPMDYAIEMADVKRIIFECLQKCGVDIATIRKDSQEVWVRDGERNNS
jgi:hypothetical protein